MQMNIFPDLSLLAIVVIFALNYLVVRKFFLQPVNGVLEAREQETKTADQLYEQAMSRLSEATAEMEAKLHGAKREAAQVRDRFRAEAATHRASVVETTQGEARKLLDEADAKLQSDVVAARDRIARETENLARMAAEQILGRAV